MTTLQSVAHAVAVAAIVFTTSAHAELMASKSIDGGGLVQIYSDRGTCPGRRQVAIVTSAEGIASRGCWEMDDQGVIVFLANGETREFGTRGFDATAFGKAIADELEKQLPALEGKSRI